MWSVKCGVWSARCLKCELWSVECKVSSVKFKAVAQCVE